MRHNNKFADGDGVGDLLDVVRRYRLVLAFDYLSYLLLLSICAVVLLPYDTCFGGNLSPMFASAGDVRCGNFRMLLAGVRVNPVPR